MDSKNNGIMLIREQECIDLLIVVHFFFITRKINILIHHFEHYAELSLNQYNRIQLTKA